MKIKEFFKRWKKGIKELPPDKILASKRIGTIGTLAGVTLGFGIMAYKGSWYFLLLWFFICWLQVTELIAINQQLVTARRMRKILEEAQNGKHDGTENTSRQEDNNITEEDKVQH